jgi:hypothetical protein
MIRHDHRLCRFNVLACLHIADETLVRLTRMRAHGPELHNRHKMDLPSYRAEMTERINTALDERLRLMRLRDALRRQGSTREEGRSV